MTTPKLPRTNEHCDQSSHGMPAEIGVACICSQLRRYRNAWLEAAAEAVKESGYLYGRESALAAIRKLKDEP